MTGKWEEQGERGSRWLVRLILWIALNIGRRAARFLLYPITAYFYLTAKEQRRASRQYLNRVLERPPSSIEVATHIFTFSSVILDRVFLLAGKYGYYRFKIKNPEVLLELTDQGEGCLLLGAHVGSFEALRALASTEVKLPLKILMYPEHNHTVTSLLNQLNPGIAKTIIPLGQMDSMLRVHEAIQGGSVVGMLGDRVSGDTKQVYCEFLNEKASFPAGPAILASVLGAAVVMFIALYCGKGKYEVYFERLPDIQLKGREDRKEVIQEWVQCYASRLEKYVRRAPYNWFNFYEFWNKG